MRSALIYEVRYWLRGGASKFEHAVFPIVGKQQATAVAKLLRGNPSIQTVTVEPTGRRGIIME